jgi:hypothetical protein
MKPHPFLNLRAWSAMAAGPAVVLLMLAMATYEKPPLPIPAVLPRPTEREFQDRVAQQLRLSAAQRQRFEAALAENARKTRALYAQKASGAISPEEGRVRTLDNFRELTSAMRGILTAEQYLFWEQALDARVRSTIEWHRQRLAGQ